jgi:opacity protein-like surface antigen
MKNTLLLGLLLTFTLTTFSQDSKFSLELSYPIPIDQNFIGDQYSGVVDVGAKYRFAELNVIRMGASLNGGLLVNNSNKNNGPLNFSVNAYMLQPRIFAELDIEALKKFRPTLGLGYTFMIFDVSGTLNGVDVSDENSNLDGLNFNLGIAYNISYKFFAQVQYDFVKIKVEDDVPDVTYNTNINILKIGFGYRL